MSIGRKGLTAMPTTGCVWAVGLGGCMSHLLGERRTAPHPPLCFYVRACAKNERVNMPSCQ